MNSVMACDFWNFIIFLVAALHSSVQVWGKPMPSSEPRSGPEWRDDPKCERQGLTTENLDIVSSCMHCMLHVLYTGSTVASREKRCSKIACAKVNAVVKKD